MLLQIQDGTLSIGAQTVLAHLILRSVEMRRLPS